MSELRTRNCPRCGEPPTLVLPGQFFCGTDGCPVFSWNPHADAATFEATATTIDLSGER